MSMTIYVAKQQSVYNERLGPGRRVSFKMWDGRGFLILSKDDTNLYRVDVLAVDK